MLMLRKLTSLHGKCSKISIRGNLKESWLLLLVTQEYLCSQLSRKLNRMYQHTRQKVMEQTVIRLKILNLRKYKVVLVSLKALSLRHHASQSWIGVSYRRRPLELLHHWKWSRYRHKSPTNFSALIKDPTSPKQSIKTSLEYLQARKTSTFGRTETKTILMTHESWQRLRMLRMRWELLMISSTYTKSKKLH